jgi:hypothetical protein
LAKKLGFKAGATVATIDAPRDYRARLADLPEGVRIRAGVASAGPLGTVHVFATSRAALGRHLRALRTRLQPAGFVWVSWPKKASRVDTDITEDVIRELALPLGFVDVKVCAVTDVWSGLKLVVRKSER